MEAGLKHFDGDGSWVGIDQLKRRSKYSGVVVWYETTIQTVQ